MNNWVIRLFTWFFRLFPINPAKVLFQSYYGANYGCNPKYLSEYIVCNHSERLKPVWAFTDIEKYRGIPGIGLVRYGSVRYFFHLCTAGTIVHNYRMPVWYKKRERQLYIQTWHSSLRLKMIERDAEKSLKPNYKEMALHDSEQISLLLSGCKFSSEIFHRAFWYDGELLEAGTPRTDIFFHSSDSIKRKVYEALGISLSRKTLLYAPTFRESHTTEAYDVDFCRVTQALERRFGGEWVVVLRLHPHLMNISSRWVGEGEAQIVDATRYDDIQELLCSVDAVISDYSSLVFDYMFTGRPIWLYASDYEVYRDKERGLYFTLEDLPFSLAQTNEVLISLIEKFDRESYQDRVNAFHKKTGNFEVGKASEIITNRILKEQKL